MLHSPNITREVRYAQGERQIVLWSRELDPATDEWFESSVTCSVSFDLGEIRTQLGNRLIVPGTARNGDTVIELWTIPGWTGGWDVTSQVPSTPLGVPNPSSSLQVSIGIVGGGSFVPPQGRSARPPIVREEVYRGSGLGSADFIAFDPFGRFIHVLSQSPPAIFALDLSVDGASPIEVAGPSDLIGLDSARSIVPRTHLDYGRVYLLHHVGLFPGTDELLKSVIYDPDDDGIFDSFQSLDAVQFETAFPPNSLDYSGFAWWWVD
ncbi:hypothetical protein [Engelhardtia mirabilis]|uniref:Uncharacterized protein n=1 Tax=Engelhardtia mirabilis TaxID=2528011 RepID=A0A518BFY7_9BACT|nr:hypothetical protein Pla133_09540 [Planctomycetes bacterium Pla133]QDV00214.1 hypothetical protein Pla86_09530 [Planctomycetes bacterium Pla86]